jgi:TonB family protein
MSMSDLPANAATLPPNHAPPLAGGWSRRKFIVLIFLALLVHLALIFVFGTRKPLPLRPVTAVPHLQLASPDNETIALGDPTLFARPNAHDLVSAFWRRLPPVPPPDFDRVATEHPEYWPPTPADFGAVFHSLVENTRSEEPALVFKPNPQPVIPDIADDDLSPATTLRMAGKLAGRRLMTSPPLPPLPRNDVIEPSRVEALVDTTGNVISAVVLDPTQDSAADQLAVQLVRALRFAPAPELMLGDITITWHTVPLSATNQPSH